MKIRDIIKMRHSNDGTRSLFESTMMPELTLALADWAKAKLKGVLIGGLALSYHAVPRMTQDIDYLFLSNNDVPNQVNGFRHHRDHAFQHDKTHAEVEVLTPEFLKISPALVQKVIETATESNGIRIASPSGIVALKLNRLTHQDGSDIIALIKTGKVTDLSEFNLSPEKIKVFQELVEIAKTDQHPS